MRRLTRLSARVAAAVAVAAMLAACGGGAGEEVEGSGAVLDLPFDTTPHVSDAAAASERLGWDVALAITDANAIVSPSSLSMSIALLGEGAEGASQTSIEQATGLAGDERSAAFGALRQALTDYEDLPKSVSADSPPQTPLVHQASQVVAISAPVGREFLERIKTYYDAGATQAEPGDAQAVLDAWVKKNTAGLIEKSGIEVGGDTRAVVQDAVLFAAAWRTPFGSDTVLDFAREGGSAPVDGVVETLDVAYAETDRWAAARLPYDDALAADVILPAPGLTPSDLTAEDLADAREALDGATPESVTVTMPTFDLASKVDLLKALPSVDLGDVGGISPGTYVGQWVQQARLAVSAKGTVGAAVTEAATETSAVMPEHTLTLDRPYVLRVLDTRTGWPLFLARIADPTAE
ncbi:serpin family protein [Tessaracoccus palaemonis]|uniref:Serpin domain-containing protein n=1 Tax=Tessaracoccus palaemonis TaxID=2829499 RepID=A0ABX8SKA0_9ACTN|nr:serpin family protein [Tessaracoccus palaemonis]QXT63319.1 hypothetical protein KDB89_02205 [Tessaracoccus palaemonis]